MSGNWNKRKQGILNKFDAKENFKESFLPHLSLWEMLIKTQWIVVPVLAWVYKIYPHVLQGWGGLRRCIQQIGTWSNRLRKMGGTKKWMGEPWEGGKKQQHVKHEGEKEHGQSGCWKIYGSTWNREPSESGVKEWKVKLKQVTVVLSYTTHSFIPNVSLLL